MWNQKGWARPLSKSKLLIPLSLSSFICKMEAQTARAVGDSKEIMQNGFVICKSTYRFWLSCCCSYDWALHTHRAPLLLRLLTKELRGRKAKALFTHQEEVKPPLEPRSSLRSEHI